MILEGEIKDAKMSTFSSDFQTLIKHQFPLYFLYELFMNWRKYFLNQMTPSCPFPLTAVKMGDRLTSKVLLPAQIHHPSKFNNHCTL